MKEIYEYFPDLTKVQYEQFAQLDELYRFWNERINVISRKDIDNLYSHHVLHSLAIARCFEFKQQSSILDVGTGGGFPGIPLAIMFPKVQFCLIDAIEKKIKVVNEVVASLGLENVRAMQMRVENFPERFDYVVSRAVTSFPEFYKIARKSVSTICNNKLHNGIIYLKGGDFFEEMTGFKKYKIFNISNFYTDEFFETKKIIYLPVEY